MKTLLLTLLSLFIFLCCYSRDTTENYGIIPAPAQIDKGSGILSIGKDISIYYGNVKDSVIANLYARFLLDRYGMQKKATRFRQQKGRYILFSSTSGNAGEGYQLEIDSSKLIIYGEDAGLFYGLQTLLQLHFSQPGNEAVLPALSIKDLPRFGYRGVHLDVALHMFPISFLKKLIDQMAAYKLNTFHWHLTEDQGWRLEIKKYPELTRVGAWRAQTLLGSAQVNPMGYDSIPHGGFYTREEVRELVDYASQRYINIIPEIEMPGHCISALAAYPHLACGDDPGPFKTIESWGIYEDVFCAGKESTFTFLEDVLTEVIEMFPGKYIHIGEDEVPKTRWKNCKYCQQRIKDENLADEKELQSYFIKRIERFLNRRGRTMIGWDEILEGGLAPNAVVMSWRGEKGGIEAVKQNHRVIMTPNNYIYFDHYQANPEQEPLAYPGLNTLETVYNYNPVPQTFNENQEKLVIGAQACIWTEYMATEAKVEYMTFPRLLALSEICWTDPARKNYREFLENRIPVHLGRFDTTDLLFFVPPAIGIQDGRVIQGKSFTIELKAPVKGARIFYTLDDTNPRETDYNYEAPIVIKVPDGQKRILKTIVITGAGKRSAITKTTFINTRPPALINR